MQSERNGVLERDPNRRSARESERDGRRNAAVCERARQVRREKERERKRE